MIKMVCKCLCLLFILQIILWYVKNTDILSDNCGIKNSSCSKQPVYNCRKNLVKVYFCLQQQNNYLILASAKRIKQYDVVVV